MDAAAAIAAFLLLLGMALVAVGMLGAAVFGILAAFSDRVVGTPRSAVVPHPSPHLLATSRARESAASVVARAYADGRLALPELEERLGRALRARSEADIARACAGLEAPERRVSISPFLGLAGIALVLLAGSDGVRIAGGALVLISLFAPGRVRTLPVVVTAGILALFSLPASLLVAASVVPGLHSRPTRNAYSVVTTRETREAILRR